MGSVSTSVKTKELLRRLIPVLRREKSGLCKYCLLRQVASDTKICSQIMSSDNKNQCSICNGLMHETDSILKMIEKTLDNSYHFDTFSIGATLPANLLEREDQIRARFKIRGMENIKSQLLRVLRKRFSEVSNKRVDFSHPDLMITLQFQKDTSLDIEIRMRPVIMFCRYIKKKEA